MTPKPPVKRSSITLKTVLSPAIGAMGILRRESESRGSAGSGSGANTPNGKTRRASRRMSSLLKYAGVDVNNNEEQQKAAPPLISPPKGLGVVKDKIQTGGYFGEKALTTTNRRNASIVADEDSQLLVVDKATFTYVLSNFEKLNKELMLFLKEFLPKIDDIFNADIVANLLYLFEEVEFEYENTITEQGKPG